MAGKVKLDRCASTNFAINACFPVGLSGKAVHHGKTQPGAFSDRPCRVEGFKNSADNFQGHASAVIRHTQDDELASRHAVRPGGGRISKLAFAVSTVSVPPLGMASRALRHRFNRAFSS
jgi:hypothetical protein